MRPTTYTFAAADTAYVCALQTTSGSGSLLINGTGSDKNFPNSFMTLTGSGFARPISLTSTGNISGVNFTITGTDIRGAALTETIAGPNNNTVHTTASFYTVTSVTVNGAVATNTSLGIYSTGISQWYCMDYLVTPSNIGLGVTAVSGTINWTVQQTTYNVQAAEPPAAAILPHPDSTLVAQTVSRQGNYDAPFNACQIVVNSSSAGGNLVINIYQAGIV